ncbi:hypothetical protein HOY80DRAFT_994818 [Tuber brumale]|nr:hypothetical protein HOY80DRAFT_994818 [Tuber brumale]
MGHCSWFVRWAITVAGSFSKGGLAKPAAFLVRGGLKRFANVLDVVLGAGGAGVGGGPGARWRARFAGWGAPPFGFRCGQSCSMAVAK